MKNSFLLMLCLHGLFSACGQKKEPIAYDPACIRFHEYGKGVPVFVLTGGPGNDCHQLEDLAIQLGEKYHAVLPEQRGTGLSIPAVMDERSINMDFCIKDILFIMDSLKIGKAIFCGHSWGALLSTAFAIAHPEKVIALVLIGPGPMSYENKYWQPMLENKINRIGKDRWKRYLELYTKVNRRSIDTAELREYKWLNASMAIYDTTHAEKVFAAISKGERNQQTFLLMNVFLGSRDFNLTKGIPGLQMPISVITGSDDPMAFLTNAFQGFAPAAKIYWIPKSGHFPMFEQPDTFYKSLQEVLTGLTGK